MYSIFVEIYYKRILMMELHTAQIEGMKVVIEAVTKDKLGVTLSAIGFPSARIEESNGKFIFTVTKNGPNGLDVSHLFDNTDDRLRSYITLILTIKQLQKDGYLYLVDVDVPKKKYSFIDDSDKQPKWIDIKDEEIFSFLKENFYKSIFLTNELIEYVNTGKTKEQRIFDIQMSDTERKHNEAMCKAQKTLCWTRLAFFVALIPSLLGVYSFFSDLAIRDINNTIKEKNILDVGSAKMTNDTIEAIISSPEIENQAINKQDILKKGTQ